MDRRKLGLWRDANLHFGGCETTLFGCEPASFGCEPALFEVRIITLGGGKTWFHFFFGRAGQKISAQGRVVGIGICVDLGRFPALSV